MFTDQQVRRLFKLIQRKRGQKKKGVRKKGSNLHLTLVCFFILNKLLMIPMMRSIDGIILLKSLKPFTI